MTQSTKQTFVKLATAANSIAWVLPQNIEKIESKLNKVKAPKWGQTFTDQRDTKRHFPQYTAGMGTGEYISRYESLNRGLEFTKPYDISAFPENSTDYDGDIPLFVADENPDYDPADDIAPVAKVKAKSARRDIKGERIAELEDILLEALPFIEDLTEDPHYKQGKVLAFRAKIRAALDIK